jgi:hypothetical protein
MKDYRTILSNVGWVLIAIGVVDIGYMVYCISNQTNYSSSFNIFAVIAGVFLLRGSLKAARIISWFMAFSIAFFTGVLIVMPLLFPFDLLVAYVRHARASAISAIVFIPVLMALLVWIYRRLTSPAIREAMDEAQINRTPFWRNPARGFWIGGCLPLILVVFLSLLMSGSTADEAKRRAAAQVGDGYKFHVKSLNMSSGTRGKHVHAVVTAYNADEIKDVVVEWSE